MKKLIALFLSFIVLISALDLNAKAHFCGVYLVDVSFFGDAANCGMEQDSKEPRSSCGIKAKSCCSDKSFQLESQDFIFKRDVKKKESVMTRCSIPLKEVKQEIISISFFLQAKQFLRCDLNILFQVFRI